MMEKLLDKYFAKKAIYILWDKLCDLSIEKEIRQDKNSYQLFIKKPKYKDTYYKKFWTIKFSDGLEAYEKIYKMDDKELHKHAELILAD